MEFATVNLIPIYLESNLVPTGSFMRNGLSICKNYPHFPLSDIPEVVAMLFLMESPVYYYGSGIVINIRSRVNSSVVIQVFTQIITFQITS